MLHSNYFSLPRVAAAFASLENHDLRVGEVRFSEKAWEEVRHLVEPLMEKGKFWDAKVTIGGETYFDLAPERYGLIFLFEALDWARSQEIQDLRAHIKTLQEKYGDQTLVPGKRDVDEYFWPIARYDAELSNGSFGQEGALSDQPSEG